MKRCYRFVEDEKLKDFLVRLLIGERRWDLLALWLNQVVSEAVRQDNL